MRGLPTRGSCISKGSPELQHIDLGYTAVTDVGLANVRGLTQLEDLRLGHTQITDAGLVHLRGMTKLKFLNLDGTALTDAGMAEIVQEFPAARRPSRG